MSESGTPDVDLVDRIARGDQQAFLALYDRYAGRVHGLTLRILGDSMLAEEATQDTFLKLWSRARSYLAVRGAFSVWLLTIARRTALDRLRVERRRPVLSDQNDPETLWQSVPDGRQEPGEARWRTLHFAVMELPPEQRQVLELAFFQGMSHSDIAAELHWPIGTVKTRIRSAMQALRRVWSSDA